MLMSLEGSRLSKSGVHFLRQEGGVEPSGQALRPGDPHPPPSAPSPPLLRCSVRIGQDVCDHHQWGFIRQTQNADFAFAAGF